jgi:hypothetical protein
MMHPYIARELISQRISEMQALASRDAVAKKAARNRRNRRAATSEIPVPRVPDYVDELLCGAVDRSHADA